MNPILKKIRFPETTVATVLDPPDRFKSILPEDRVLYSVTGKKSISYLIIFATHKKAVDTFADTYLKLLEGDAVLWICYPKGSSKRYTCDFNRDNGWDRVGLQGFEPVSQVAIDEDWSALRFRRVAYIKKMNRDPERTLSAEGKKRATGKEG